MNRSRKEEGGILLTVLVIVTVAAAIVGAAHVATSGQVLLTSRSADIDALESAAEGVLDYAYGQWRYAMDHNGLLSAADATALVSGANRPSVPPRMEIVNLSIRPVDANGVVTAEPVRTYDFRMSFVYTYVAKATLRTTGVGGERKVTLQRNLVYTSVPPTRGMFFSEGDFELYKPAKMVIGGGVHTNSNAHVSTGTKSADLLFLANAKVTYVGTYDNGVPAGASNWSSPGTIYKPTYENGLANQVKKVPEIAGIGLGTAAEYNTTDSNPNNDGNRELIEPPIAGHPDPESIANSRIYNNAGIVIEVTGPINQSQPLTLVNGAYTGSNIRIVPKNGTTLTATQANTIKTAVTNANVTQVQTWVPKLVQITERVWVENLVKVKGKWVDQGWWENQTRTVDQGSYVTENRYTQKTIYDKRETQNIPITNLDVGAVTPTLNGLNNFNGLLYIHDTGSGDKNAIRVANGGILPNGGLTIATENGMYVQGDYNTGTTNNPNAVPSNANPASNASTTVSGYTTKSAALVADAIMVLSNSWSDSNSDKTVGSRNATNTTLNTALIGGYLPSKEGGNNGRSGYSGGMNNFPRFLETWTGDSMTFSGAFVSLYKSKLFTGSWDTGDIYVPPTRYWYFDTLLLSRVLPGIPATGGFVRGPLSRLDPNDAT